MHVLCPSCAAEYQIPELQRPRKLRCARCSAEWRVVPAADPEPPADADAQAGADADADADFDGPAPADAADAASPTPPDAPAIGLSPLASLQAESRISHPGLSRPASRADLVWLLLWGLSGLLIGLAVFAFWHWRGVIGHGWPPSLRLYRLLPGGP